MVSLNIIHMFCLYFRYASGIYTCYYRLAILVNDAEEKRKLFGDVKKDYADVFRMGRKIWKRPTHPSRLRIFYDFAMLCIRFNQLEDDDTIRLFHQQLADVNNFNFKVLDEIQFANSIDKVVRLENHVIDQFGKSSACASARSSFRSKAESRRSSITSPKLGVRYVNRREQE